MTTHAAAAVDAAIVVDEVGIETGVYRDYRLKTSYQPIFRREGESLRPVAVDAFVAPFHAGALVPVAEWSGAVDDDDRQFIRALCQALHLRNHRNIGVPGLKLHIGYDAGAPADQAAAIGRFEKLLGSLEGLDLDPRQLVCELRGNQTAGGAMLAVLAAEMRGHGVTMAVCDFGTGHSTMSQIEMLKPQMVRVDGAWFRALCRERAAVKLLGPIVRLLRQIGAAVLIDGIETTTQLEAALASGAEYVQGSRLAPPALAGTLFDSAARPLSVLLYPNEKVVPLFAASAKHQRP